MRELVEEAKAEVLALHPDLEGGGLLDFSLGQYFANCKAEAAR